MGLGFEGKTAIVTGAAGGVGGEVVRLLLEAGANVVAEDIRPAISELEEDRVATLVGDVRDGATAAAAVELARERFGGLDVLVNNAAKFVFKPTLETSEDEWDELMAINVKGVFVHSRAALPALVESGGGAIVNMASTSGLTGAPGQLLYSATKGAIIQITRVLAVEFATAGVRVNAVAPGAIQTDFVNESLSTLSEADAREAVAAVEALHPLGRFATAAEIAQVVVFLASPASSFLTGSIVAADGGYTAQ